MHETQTDRYRREAEDCLAKAQTASTVALKEIWLQMARQYLMLAGIPGDALKDQPKGNGDQGTDG